MNAVATSATADTATVKMGAIYFGYINYAATLLKVDEPFLLERVGLKAFADLIAFRVDAATLESLLRGADQHLSRSTCSEDFAVENL